MQQAEAEAWSLIVLVHLCQHQVRIIEKAQQFDHEKWQQLHTLYAYQKTRTMPKYYAYGNQHSDQCYPVNNNEGHLDQGNHFRSLTVIFLHHVHKKCDKTPRARATLYSLTRCCTTLIPHDQVTVTM